MEKGGEFIIRIARFARVPYGGGKQKTQRTFVRPAFCSSGDSVAHPPQADSRVQAGVGLLKETLSRYAPSVLFSCLLAHASMARSHKKSPAGMRKAFSRRQGD